MRHVLALDDIRGVVLPILDDVCMRAAKLWRDGGRTPGTIQTYLFWVRRFRADCADRGDTEALMLTRDRVDRFATRYIRARGCEQDAARRSARSALRAWSCALRSLGFEVPRWNEATSPHPLSRLLARFVEHRLQHGGVAPTTVRTEVPYVTAFIGFLRKRHRRPDAVRIVDIDEFITSCCASMARKTVAGICSALRAFLRFLVVIGRLAHDLASSVMAPRVRSQDRPPRALPWKDVQRLLGAIDDRAQLGRRDFAMLLTMATYGMGAGEVLGLRLDDIDWSGHTLCVRRPKTGVSIVLPLLDPVARALADYLHHERPAHAVAREIFVSHRMPHARLAGAGAICHRLVKHATTARLTPTFLGSHVLRHSHACRQIEIGATPKVVSDILGHRRPSSTSAYVRVATNRLRGVALRVPT
jgi:site-specific recombinase XerD